MIVPNLTHLDSACQILGQKWLDNGLFGHYQAVLDKHPKCQMLGPEWLDNGLFGQHKKVH